MKYKRQIMIAAICIMIAVSAGIGGYVCYTGQTAGYSEEPMPEAREENPGEDVETPARETVQKKQETVYVQADARGAAREVIVSDILRNGTSSDTIADQSDLENIKNVKGKEAYTKNEDGDLIWQAAGEDIYYQGTTDKALPVELKITYYLEGEEIDPGKLAGKAGNVRIRFDYINHEMRTVTVNGEERNIYIPFAALTGVILDEEKFANVEMENGKVISDGSRIMAGGFVMPGLSESVALSEIEDMDDLDVPEYLELTAYTTDFALPMTMTAVTADFSEELDLDELDFYEDLKDDMQELKDASDELVDGTHELVDGVVELKDGTDELYDGAVELDDGAKKIKDGAVELDNGAYELFDGAVDLKDALKAYNAGLDELTAVMNNAGGENVSIAAVGATLSDGVGSLVDTMLKSIPAQVNAKLEAAGLPVTFEDYGQILEAPEEYGLEDVKAQIKELLTLKEGMKQYTEGVAAVYGAVTTQLEPNGEKILKGARELRDGTKELKEGTEKLLDGAVELKDGTIELLDGTVELRDGVWELYDGSIELRDGMEEFDRDGIQKLYDMVCKDLQNVIDRTRAIADAGKAYKAYTRIMPDMEGSVKFLIETEAIE